MEDFNAMLIAELPDNQLREVTRWATRLREHDAYPAVCQ
jgi:hypothetical protein